jgi:hypothetical protein
VKRESERRQRDRDRSGNIGIPINSGMTGGKRVTIVEDGDIGTSQYTVEVRLCCVTDEREWKPLHGLELANMIPNILSTCN